MKNFEFFSVFLFCTQDIKVHFIVRLVNSIALFRKNDLTMQGLEVIFYFSYNRFLNEPLATLRAVGSADGYKDRIRVREGGDGARG